MAPCSPVVSDQPAFWHLDAARGPSTPSFDHLVGAGEQGWWDFDAERPSGLEIDDQLVLGRLLDRKVGGLGSLEDFIHKTSCPTIEVGVVHAVRHQAAVIDNVLECVDRRELVFCTQANNGSAVCLNQAVVSHDDCVSTLPGS